MALPPVWLQAVAAVDPSDSARSPAEAAATTDVRNLPLPTPSPSEYYKSKKRERRSKLAGRGPALVVETCGGGLLRSVAPVSGANELGAASTRGYLKVGPGGP